MDKEEIFHKTENLPTNKKNEKEKNLKRERIKNKK